MSFEPETFLQNIELKLRGRTAFLAVGEVVLLAALWVLMRGYSEHAIFSIVGGSTLLAAILGFLGLGILGKSRPEEVEQKSLTHVTQMGVVIAHGISSHKDMVQIMRQLSGISKLPSPTHAVRGSAANEASYIPLTQEQSNKLIESIEQQIEKMLGEVVTSPTGRHPQLQEPEEQPAPTPIKGKKLSD